VWCSIFLENAAVGMNSYPKRAIFVQTGTRNSALVLQHLPNNRWKKLLARENQ